jgi:hypothetical protein
MEHEEDAPATSGEVRIATITGLGGYVAHKWPIAQAGYMQPEISLLLRVMDNGEIYAAHLENWDAALDGDDD